MTKLAACCKHKFDEEKVYDYFGAKEIDKICGKLYRLFSSHHPVF